MKYKLKHYISKIYRILDFKSYMMSFVLSYYQALTILFPIVVSIIYTFIIMPLITVDRIYLIFSFVPVIFIAVFICMKVMLSKEFNSLKRYASIPTLKRISKNCDYFQGAVIASYMIFLTLIPSATIKLVNIDSSQTENKNMIFEDISFNNQFTALLIVSFASSLLYERKYICDYMIDRINEEKEEYL